MEKQNKKKCRLIFAIIFSVLIRIVLQMGIPVMIIGDAAVDDKLFVDYAKSILESTWLGNYSAYTLNKMPGFGIFLAILKYLNIPYMLGIILLYCFACCVFFVVLKKIVHNDAISYFMFIYVLFSPVMLDTQVSQRIYRMSIIPSLVLLVVSSYLAIYVERDKGYKGILPWAVLAGIAYAIFYIIREDAMWFTCFVFGASVLIICLIFFENKHKGEWRKRIYSALCLLIPLILCIVGVTSLKFINYRNYGVFTTTDFKDTYYADMGKEILKIKPDEEKEHVWVTRDTIDTLYEISPTFATLKPELDKLYVGMDSWATGAIDGEIEKDYIIWAIRWAADTSGVYQQGATYTNMFYKQVYDDILEAFADGKLEKRDAIILSNLARPFVFSRDFKPCLEFVWTEMRELVSYSVYKCRSGISQGSEEQIREMSEMTSTLPAYEDEYMFNYLKNINMANRITKVYQLTGYFVAVLAFLMYIYELIYCIVCRRKNEKVSIADWIVKTGILLTIFADLLMVSLNYFDAYNKDNAVNLYTAGVIPLWNIFVCLCMVTFMTHLNRIITNAKEKKQLREVNLR